MLFTASGASRLPQIRLSIPVFSCDRDPYRHGVQTLRSWLLPARGNGGRLSGRSALLQVRNIARRNASIFIGGYRHFFLCGEKRDEVTVSLVSIALFRESVLAS